MQKGLQKINSFIEKIGISNFILLVFVICAVLISSLYATFSLSTVNEGSYIINDIKTLKFILNDEENEGEVTIAGGSSKNIAITISNKEKIDLEYGIYYVSLDDLTEVDLGYKHNSEHPAKGTIEKEKDYIVTINIENKSNDPKTIIFGITYGLKTGGELVIGENQKFLEEKWNFPLNEVAKGSYVEYVGNNGCGEEGCKGQNANQFDDHKGYCGDELTAYKEEGWRVAYTKNENTYLITAGSPECLGQEKEDNKTIQKLLNEIALNYCNIDYAESGICNEKTAWSISEKDYYYITNSWLNKESCYEQENNQNCGHKNDLMDIGSYYWLNTIIDDKITYYTPEKSLYTSITTEQAKGIRPIIKLSSSIIVTKGTGTKEDPYQIENTKIPNYEYTVIYNGNGNTEGNTENSIHQTNTPSKLNKNNFTLNYQLDLSKIATFDDSYCDENNNCTPSSNNTMEAKEAKFLGWSTNPDAKEATYKDEQEVVNLSTHSSDVIINLYAIWDYGKIELPEIQEREGYDILGWYTENGEKVGNPKDEYTGTNNIHLYAKWQKKS